MSLAVQKPDQARLTRVIAYVSLAIMTERKTSC